MRASCTTRPQGSLKTPEKVRNVQARGSASIARDPRLQPRQAPGRHRRCSCRTAWNRSMSPGSGAIDAVLQEREGARRRMRRARRRAGSRARRAAPRTTAASPGSPRTSAAITAASGAGAASSSSIAFGARFQTSLNQAIAMSVAARLRRIRGPERRLAAPARSSQREDRRRVGDDRRRGVSSTGTSSWPLSATSGERSAGSTSTQVHRDRLCASASATRSTFVENAMRWTRSSRAPGPQP